MDELDKDEQRFLALRETLGLYAAAARERDDASDEERDEADRKVKALSKVARAIVAVQLDD